MHLAKNPELAMELLTMPVTKAAVKLATQVKAAALSRQTEIKQGT